MKKGATSACRRHGEWFTVLGQILTAWAADQQISAYDPRSGRFNQIFYIRRLR